MCVCAVYHERRDEEAAMNVRGALPALALAALFAVAAPEARADHKGKIPWVTDPTQGFAQARREGKPIMIFFTADW
jgi:hypothetical protein